MAGIQSSTGLISGVPIQDTVDQLMKIASQPRDRLVKANATLQSRQLAVGQLTALVIGVQLSTDQLGSSTLYSQTKVSSSAKSITATATSTANPGSYQFVPVRLAQQQQYTSSALASSDQLVGAGEIEVHAGGFLDSSLTLDELNGGAGVARGKIRITDRSGANATIDLRFAHTASDIVEAINSSADIRVTAKIDGDRFVLTDTSSGSGSLSVSEVSNGTTARDLGLATLSVSGNVNTGTDVVSLSRTTALRTLLDGRGVQLASGSNPSLRVTLKDGSSIDVTTNLSSNSASVGQLIDAINTAGSGKLRASINTAGDGLQLEDLTSGSGTFAVTSPNGNLAANLGWNQAASGSTIAGAKLQSGLSDVLLSSLNGGASLGTLGQLNLQDRSGATATVNLSSAKTIGDVVKAINSSGIGVTAQLNESRTGITLVDTSGGTTTALAATDGDSTNTATKLGLTSTVDPSRIRGKSLQRQWINENTLLTEWNQGKGLTFGSIKITNSAGKQSAYNFASSAPKTVGDLLKTINDTADGFEARINETGDGLLLVDKANGAASLEVVDVGSGTTAKQLKIAGTSKSLTVGNATVQGIDGSLDYKITTTADTTVSQLVSKINDGGDAIDASLLTLGSGGVRLSLTSSSGGQRGRVTLDSSTLAISFSETSKGQDALLSTGGSGGGVLLSSSSNTFNSAIPGVTLTLTEASGTAVTVDVTSNTDAISKQLSTVVDQFNKLRDKISEVTKFDSGNFTTGLLFGSSDALKIDLVFSQLFSGTHAGNGRIRSIAELGVSFNDQGKLEFNKDRFDAALKRDPEAVKKFLSTSKTGFSAKAKVAADTLAGTKNGSLLKSTETLQAKIELNAGRISSLEVRLTRERTRLLTQFYNMETAISKIQTNLTAINSVASLVNSTSSSSSS